jgi:hypothetical protein
MTVWQNLKTNSTLRIVESMLDVCKKAIAAFTHIPRFLEQLLPHKSPEFIKLHILPSSIILFHIKNKHILERFETTIAQMKNAQFASFLAPLAKLPLQILIDDEDVNYRLISLRQTKWWNRYGLFNQIQIAEFDKTDWIYTEHVPSPTDLYRHVFIGFKPSPLVLETFMYLNNLQNPIAKIQLSSVQQAAAAINRITEHEPTQSFCPWTLFIRRISDTHWLLSAQQYGAIVLSRRGTFSANNSEELTIENEIVTTLRYLQRNGYEEGEKLTLITAGFSDEFNKHSFESVNIADVISVPVRDLDTRIQLKSHFEEFTSHGFWILNQLRTILNKSHPIYHKGFHPKALLSQRLAYWTPFVCRQFILPLCVGCMLILVTYASKNQILHDEIKTTLFKKNAMFATTGDAKRREIAANFNIFKDLTGENPITFLKVLSVSLAKEAYITHFSWDTKNNKHKSTFFEATVHMLDRTNITKRKIKSSKSIGTYQQKVQKKLQKAYPNTTVIWLPTPEKTTYTLGVSWD